MIVTIDGPAGSGKSTAARELARRLGFRFLDTGAMYRAVAWACLDRRVPLDDAETVAEVARGLRIEFDNDRVLADGRDVTEAIRTPAVTEAASVVATNPQVREALAAKQRAIGRRGDIVTEGRDQGTVVFPDAEVKFFLTAGPEVRARRRQQELAAKGQSVPLAAVLEQIHQRDRRDETRASGPLRPADDAIRIDTSDLSPTEVLDLLERTVRERQRLTQGG